MRLNENKFLKINDSVRSLYLDLLSDSNIQNYKFDSLEKKSILLDKVYNLMHFEGDKRLLTDKKKFKVSDSFPNSTKLVDLSDDSFLEIPFFIPLLANNFYYFLNESVNLDTSEEILKCVDCELTYEYLKHMGNHLKNEKVRNGATFLIAKWMLSGSENIDEFHKTFKLFNSDQEKLKYISNLYDNLKSSRGKDFLMKTILKDSANNQYTLEDFQGKYLYLDFWSSSCKPCIQEFPYFNELSQELNEQKIEFIGINIWDTKNHWQKMVKKNNLKGVQLTAGKNLKFLDSLGISGIPRYMLINEVGNVMDYNAKRPSDRNAKTELLTALTE